MADITMCSNALCPNEPRCYRAQARPDPIWQSWACFGYVVSENEVFCDHYMPMASPVLVSEDQHSTTEERENERVRPYIQADDRNR